MALVIGLLLAPAGVGIARAQDKEVGIFLTSELSGVWTTGNASTTTLGLASSLRRVWEDSEFRLEGGAVRTASGRTTRRAIGTSPDEFTVEEETDQELTAENYFVRGRYGHEISEQFLVFAGVDWLRNTFAGIESRLLVAAGTGYIWFDNEQARFRTDLGATYTFEEAVVENPFISSTFPGLRFSYDYWREITSTTDFESNLVTDWNLESTDDLRLDFVNSLAVALSSRLALKPSLRLLWRNDPALKRVALFLPDGTETGQQVLVPLEKLDTYFTLALVVKL